MEKTETCEVLSMDMADEVYEYFGTPRGGSIDLRISSNPGNGVGGDNILRKNGAQIAAA